MPYTVQNPPERIRKLPSHAIKIWVSAYNSAYAGYDPKTSRMPNREAHANAIAWAAVKRDYKKVGDKWVKKAAETFNCECLKCGYRITSEKHCIDIKCPKCGGQMRRVERPGVGRTSEQTLQNIIKQLKGQKVKSIEREDTLKYMEQFKFVEWTTKYVNDLPDSSFAYIMPGGKKDAEGKTVPRALRKLPYKDANGKVDLPHLRNAIARAPQTTGIPASAIASIQKKLRGILERMRKTAEISFPVSIRDLKFAEVEGKDVSEIQVLQTGTWNHPVYGKIKVSDKEIEEFVSNFNNGVRREIPITEGHSVGEEEKPAIGWFKQLINKGRDGLWATIEWTKDGLNLLKKKAYKYFSPEFYSNYEDPETHKVYQNVLVGGALTNRPYFKGLQAIVLSELILAKDKMELKLEDILEKEPTDLEDEEVNFLKENKDQLTDEQKDKFKDVLAEDEGGEGNESGEGGEGGEEETGEEGNEGEGEEEVEGSEKAKKKDKGKMIQVSEATLRMLEKKGEEGVKAMAKWREAEASNYVEKKIFSETNKLGPFLPKSRDKMVRFLLSLTEAQQKAFKEIVEEIPQSKMFSELGGDTGVPMKASEELDKLAKEKMDKDKNLSLRDAYDQVFSERPDLQEALANE